MRAADTRREVERLVNVLLRAGAVVDTNATLVQPYGRNELVTWATAAESDPLVERGAFGTLREYRRMLQDRQYTCLLADGAMFQISFTYRNNVLQKHRMCYYPCPVHLLPEDLSLADDVGSVVDYFLEGEFTAPTPPPRAEPTDTDLVAPTTLEEVIGVEQEDPSRVRLRSPIRFDYDLIALKPEHPASHIHLTHEECRWPVAGPLSVGHFVRFVLRHFYPEVCARAPELLAWPLEHGNRTITALEEEELYVDVRRTA